MNRRDFLAIAPFAALSRRAWSVPPRADQMTGEAIQTKIDNAKQVGGVVELAAGIYTVSDPIRVVGCAGIKIVGAGSTVGQGGTVLDWQGDPGDSVFEVADSRDCVFSDFAVKAHGGRSAQAAFLVTNTGAGGNTSTSHVWERVRVQGTNGGVAYGWCFSGADANNDLNRFLYCEVTNYSVAGWSFEHSQSKAHSFAGCSAASNGFGLYGVTTRLGSGGQGGSFYWRDGNMTGNQVSDFWLGSPNDAIVIDGLNSENSRRLLVTQGPTGSPWAVSLSGVRWSSGAPDAQIVDFRSPGPLEISGSQFRTGTAAKIRADINAGYGGIEVRGCFFDTKLQNPFEFPANQGQQRLINNIVQYGGMFYDVPNVG